MSGGGNAAANDAIAGLLFLARAFPQRLIAQREHRWLQLRREKAPADVEGQTVLIAGGGAVAAGVARFARALAMHTIGVARDASSAADCDEAHAPEHFDALLPRAQWLVIVAGDAPVLDARRIALLPRGAQLVIVADAKSFNAPALSDALQNGQVTSAYLAGVAADSPLRALPNVMFA
jgi:phosphoglycerate dehydrogenase-like enzyme